MNTYEIALQLIKDIKDSIRYYNWHKEADYFCGMDFEYSNIQYAQNKLKKLCNEV